MDVYMHIYCESVYIGLRAHLLLMRRRLTVRCRLIPLLRRQHRLNVSTGRVVRLRGSCSLRYDSKSCKCKRKALTFAYNIHTIVDVILT